MTGTGVGRSVVTRALAGAIALAASGLAAAQVAAQDGYTAQDADAAFAQLRQEVPGLRANWNFETGFPTFIFGRRFGSSACRRRTATTSDRAPSRRRLRRILRLRLLGAPHRPGEALDLASIGTSDKVAVGFTQVAGGVDVAGGNVSVLFNSDGAIVGIENNGLPNVALVDVVPTISDAQATLIAVNQFQRGSQVLGVDLGIVRTPRRPAPSSPGASSSTAASTRPRASRRRSSSRSTRTRAR
jgi:hypothetical protein